MKPVCLHTLKQQGPQWSDISYFQLRHLLCLHSFASGHEKNCDGFCPLQFYDLWARERCPSPKLGRKGLSGLQTSWAQLMSDFCLTMASICFPSKQYMDCWALYCSKYSRRHHISLERTDFFSHCLLAGRSCLLNNSGEKTNKQNPRTTKPRTKQNQTGTPEKLFWFCLCCLFGFFKLKCCFQSVFLWCEGLSCTLCTFLVSL